MRRVIEGTGQSYEAFDETSATGAQEQRHPRQQRSIHPNPITNAGDDPDLDGFESSSQWSERERKHQLERHRRKQRARQLGQREIPRQIGLQIQVRHAERADVPAWPRFPLIRAYLQSLYAGWRVLTAGGDHAKEHLQVAEDAARGIEHVHLQALEEA